MILDWPTRFQICIGIARGLAFLHDESRLKIVHRDIKATNVLLDSDLNPKISDFGLARLNEDEKTHISTKVAGTMLVHLIMLVILFQWLLTTTINTLIFLLQRIYGARICTVGLSDRQSRCLQLRSRASGNSQRKKQQQLHA